MRLSTQITQTQEGLWKVSLAEMPTIFYVGPDRAGVLDRMNQLVHALRSPHIRIERVQPDGDVVLTLDRSAEGDDAEVVDDEPPGFPRYESVALAS